MKLSLKNIIFSLVIFNFTILHTKVDLRSIFEVKSSNWLYEPKTLNELKLVVAKAREKSLKISILGAGKSQGGQTLSDLNSIRISLKKLNKLLFLDVKNKLVKVQAGMSWQQLQELISPHKLSVKAMQSFNDFSIGGSLSVNVHGQDVKNNPLIKSIKSIGIMLGNGDVIKASRQENSDLFFAAIGGYGLIGIIVDVELYLTQDVLLKRITNIIDSKNLPTFFEQNIKNNDDIQFYSARFSVGKKDFMNKMLVVGYQNVDIDDKQAYEFHPLSLNSKILNAFLRQVGILLKKSENFKNLRFGLEKKYFTREKIISRNNFMGYSINGLPYDDSSSSYILQEYFIPYNRFNEFTNCLKSVLKDYNVNVINITVRHVNQDNESLLSYAKKDCCAFVLYLNLSKNLNIYDKAYSWTSLLIDKAIDLDGAYYLPYHLIGSINQVNRAYPRLKEFMDLKQKCDPLELFSNKLYEKYKFINYS